VAHVHLIAGEILTPKVCDTFAQYSMARRPAAEFTRGVALSASDAFIKIKLALRHLLLYVVYICQKSSNFTDAFSCYKQNESWPRLIWPTLYSFV